MPRFVVDTDHVGRVFKYLVNCNCNILSGIFPIKAFITNTLTWCLLCTQCFGQQWNKLEGEPINFDSSSSFCTAHQRQMVPGSL